MMPSLPIDLHDEGVNRIEILRVVGDLLECAMLRNEVRCSNDTVDYILVHLIDGQTCFVPFCQMCVDDLPRSWMSSLIQLAQQEPRITIIKPRQKIGQGGL